MRRQCDRVRDGDLLAYLANPDDESLRDVQTHVVDCEECAAELRAWQTLRGDLLLDDTEDVDEHPVEANLSAYCDDPSSLGPALRTEIQAHLSVCPSCRDEVKVLADVRVERAALAASASDRGPDLLRAMPVDTADADGSPAMDLPFEASVPVQMVARSAWARRLRHPGVAFALVLSMTLPVIGVFVLRNGLPLPAQDGAEFSLSEELSFDPATLTAVRTSDGTAVRAHADAPDSASAAAEADAGDVPRNAVVQDVSKMLAVQSRGLGDTVDSVEGALGQEFVERVRETQQAVDVPEAAAAAGASATVVDEFEGGVEKPSEEFIPGQSAAQEVLTPEQLMAMLETERRVADMRRRSIEIPEPDDGPRTGAAIIETLPAGEADGEGEGREDAAESNSTERIAALGTARVPAESMIIGVRELGTAPVRGTMVGSPSVASSGGAGTSAVPVGAGASSRRARIHFVRGSSYVFTRDEIERGMQVRFPLPKRDGEVTAIEARVFEVGTDRELTKRFDPPNEALQSSPTVAMDVPGSWLSAGRYTVVLTTPEVESSEEQSINIRVLDAQPSVAGSTGSER